jgi:large subunit ribosomal protein L32
MAEPKQKLSRARTRKRKSTKTLKNINLVVCPNCKSKILAHRVCPVCGYYKGKQIEKIQTVKTSVTSKKKEK